MTESAYWAYLIGRFLLAMNDWDTALERFKLTHFIESISKTWIKTDQGQRSQKLLVKVDLFMEAGKLTENNASILDSLIQEIECYRDLRNYIAHGRLIAGSGLPFNEKGFSPLVLLNLNAAPGEHREAINGKTIVTWSAPLTREEMLAATVKTEHLVHQVFEIIAVMQLRSDDETSALIRQYLQARHSGEAAVEGTFLAQQRAAEKAVDRTQRGSPQRGSQ